MNNRTYFPLSALVLAINRYVVIGDDIGEGMAIEMADTKIEVPMLIHTNDPQQLRDFGCLRSRLDEVAPALGVELVLRTNMPLYQGWALRFERANVDRLVTALCEPPGGAVRTLPSSAASGRVLTPSTSSIGSAAPREEPTATEHAQAGRWRRSLSARRGPLVRPGPTGLNVTACSSTAFACAAP